MPGPPRHRSRGITVKVTPPKRRKRAANRVKRAVPAGARKAKPKTARGGAAAGFAAGLALAGAAAGGKAAHKHYRKGRKARKARRQSKRQTRDANGRFT
jgi:hypothetical protein